MGEDIVDATIDDTEDEKGKENHEKKVATDKVKLAVSEVLS